MLHRIPSIERIGAAIGWTPQLGLDRILHDVVAHVRTTPALVDEPDVAGLV
jgi:hypothetical protein